MAAQQKSRRSRDWPCRIALYRTVIILGVVAGVLAGGQRPASACSCAVGDPGAMLQQFDGAFVGRLVESAPATDSVESDLDDGYAYTFDVSEWIKGQREPGHFDVYSAGSGSSCGFETPVGAEVAVFVSVIDGRARGGLCSTADAGSLRATVRPPEIVDGPGVFLAAGWRQPSYVLNAGGGVVAVLPPDSEGEFGTSQAPCGGSIIAEHRRKEVVLFDISTFEIVENLQFARPTEQLMCNDDRVLALAGRDDAYRVYDVRTREPVSDVVSEFSSASLRQDELVYFAAVDDTTPQTWRAVDLETGEERAIAQLLTAEQRMESVDFSQDGTKIALTIAEGNQGFLDLVIVSVADGSTVARTINAHGASVVWLDADRLFVSTSDGGFAHGDPPFIVAGDDLRTLNTFTSYRFWPTQLHDSRLLGFKGASLLAMPEAGGDAEVLNELPSSSYLRLQRLPEPVQMAVGFDTDFTSIETPLPSPLIEAIVATSTKTQTPVPEPGEVIPVDDNAASGEELSETAAPVVGGVEDSPALVVGIIAGALILASSLTLGFKRRSVSRSSLNRRAEGGDT